MLPVYSRKPSKSMDLGAVLPFGLENLPIGFPAKNLISLWIKKAPLWSRQRRSRISIMKTVKDLVRKLYVRGFSIFPPRCQTPLFITVFSSLRGRGTRTNLYKKEGMILQKEQFDITGMTCSACSTRVEKSVAKLPGIKEVSVNLLKTAWLLLMMNPFWIRRESSRPLKRPVMARFPKPPHKTRAARPHRQQNRRSVRRR